MPAGDPRTPCPSTALEISFWCQVLYCSPPPYHLPYLPRTTPHATLGYETAHHSARRAYSPLFFWHHAIWWPSQRRAIWLAPIAVVAITFSYWFSPFAYASDSGKAIGYACCTSLTVPTLWMPLVIVAIAATRRFQADRRFELATLA